MKAPPPMLSRTDTVPTKAANTSTSHERGSASPSRRSVGVVNGDRRMFWKKAWSGGYSAHDHRGMETGASYWHMVDLVWIILFPLVYIMR